MDKLIFDRTNLDVINKTKKGYHDIEDLNRIEEWCGYIASLLKMYNYKVDIETKTNWKYTDERTAVQMERIRNNLNLLKGAFNNISTDVLVPNNLSPINIDKANDIEHILFQLNEAISGMENYFIYSGISRAGQPWMVQNYFRRE